MWVRASLAVLLAASLLGNWRQQPLAAVLQLLLLLCVVAADAARAAATAAAAATADWCAGADGAASDEPNRLQQIAAAILPGQKQQQQQQQQGQQQHGEAPPKHQAKARLHRPLRTASTYTLEGRSLIVPPAAAAAAAAGSVSTPQPHQLRNNAYTSSSSAQGPSAVSAFAAAASKTPFAQPAGAATNQTLDTPASAALAAGAAECPWSGGWSLQLLAGDVVASPGPFMQLQIAALSCDRWDVTACATVYHLRIQAVFCSMCLVKTGIVSVGH
jgi:hypothetical protein